MIKKKQGQQKHKDQVIDQVDQENDQPRYINKIIQQDQVSNITKQQTSPDEEQTSDPEVRFNAAPDRNIPARVTRSKNNISKASTKYDLDFVKLDNLP